MKLKQLLWLGFIAGCLVGGSVIISSFTSGCAEVVSTTTGVVDNNVQVVAVDSSDNVYIGGSFGNIEGVAETAYFARWNASSNTRESLGVAFGDISGMTNHLYGVDFVSYAEGWVVGANGAILKYNP